VLLGVGERTELDAGDAVGARGFLGFEAQHGIEVVLPQVSAGGANRGRNQGNRACIG
jgi:hypothetical protein